VSDDDRFDDLTIGERLAERDRTHPEPPRRPEVPRSANKYAWLVGFLMLMVLGVLLFVQTLPNKGEGLEGPKKGTRLKVFAAPSALGDLEGDANVCQRKPCPKQVDRTERIRADFRDVNFATLFFTSKERSEVRNLVDARGWRQPVAIDRDGAVTNLYGVGGCPTTIFARAGGTVVDTQLGNLTEEELRRRTAAL
jgi:hypothetical protein